jgi:phosphoglycolate phosphatase-like HAD superfamily hydrolase
MILDKDIEIVNPDLPRGRFRAVLFDFDGTLSLVRGGWMQIMIPMMVEELRRTGTRESDAELTGLVGEYVARLNGRQTIFQMIQLADEVRRRGGVPREPDHYKQRFLDLLMQRVEARLQDVRSGKAAPTDWAVPGAHGLLDDLKRRGLGLYLASGTELAHVRREAEVLQLTPFFGEHIYGPRDDADDFSKKKVIDAILRENGLDGEELLAFGDGVVEIEEVKRVGGVAIAVASDEERRGGVDAWKRERLLRAGADIVIPEYLRRESLLSCLFPEAVS